MVCALRNAPARTISIRLKTPNLSRLQKIPSPPFYTYLEENHDACSSSRCDDLTVTCIITTIIEFSSVKILKKYNPVRNNKKTEKKSDDYYYFLVSRQYSKNTMTGRCV